MTKLNGHGQTVHARFHRQTGHLLLAFDACEWGQAEADLRILWKIVQEARHGVRRVSDESVTKQ